jgi:hypothetical protein
MIAFGLSHEQFSAEYGRLLERCSATAIGAISDLLKRPVPGDVTEAHVEIFLDEYGGAPIVWIYHRGRNNKVDSSDPNIFPGKSTELLALEDLAQFDEQYFIDAFPGPILAAPVLLAWFARCWQKAGGNSYTVPTTLNVHDFGQEKPLVLSKGGA